MMKIKNPAISIIIANYNFAKYIGDALESVRVQSFRDWECIVIDDGSTDNSVKIIKQFCKRDKRFRLIQNTITPVYRRHETPVWTRHVAIISRFWILTIVLLTMRWKCCIISHAQRAQI